MFYYDGGIEEIPDGYEEIGDFSIETQTLKTYTIKTEGVLKRDTEYELPCNYTVGGNNLEIYVEGILLSKNQHYEEIGEVGEQNNKVKFGWDISQNSIITIKIVGSVQVATEETTALVQKMKEIENKLEDTGWITATLEDGVSTVEEGLGGSKEGIKYRKIGNHVFVKGSVSCTYNGSAVLLTKIPAEFRPNLNQYRIVALGGTNIARIIIATSGNVSLEWAKAISNGENVQNVTWLAVDFDYWLDLI